MVGIGVGEWMSLVPPICYISNRIIQASDPKQEQQSKNQTYEKVTTILKTHAESQF